MLHFEVTAIDVVVDIEHLSVPPVFIALIENAEHLYEPVVDATVQQWNLHDDTIVHKAFHKRIGHTLRHFCSIVVVGFMPHIQNRFLDVAHTMSEQVDCDHRDAVTIRIVILQYIVGICILSAKILAETQGLGLKPRLL